MLTPQLWLIFSLGLSKNADVIARTDRLFSAGAILGEPRTNFPKGGWELNVDCFRFRIPDGDLANCTEKYHDRQFTAVLLETEEHPFKPTMPLRGTRRQPQDLLKDNITPLRLNLSTIIDLLERLLKACDPSTTFSQSVSIPTCPQCREILLQGLEKRQRLHDLVDQLIASNKILKNALEEICKTLSPGASAQRFTSPSSPRHLERHSLEADDNQSSCDHHEQDFVSCKDDTEEISCPLPGGHAQEHAPSALTGPPNDALFASPPGADNSADAADGHELQETRAPKRNRKADVADMSLKTHPSTPVQSTAISRAPSQVEDEGPPSEKKPRNRSFMTVETKDLFEDVIRQVFKDNPDVLFKPLELLKKINEHPDVKNSGVIFNESKRDTVRRRIEMNEKRKQAKRHR
jgi:hypothetical protein